MEVKIIQDPDRAIEVMKNVAEWMKDSGKSVSQWWNPENMNRDFLLKHTEPDEYFVAVADGKNAASVILQDTERNQSWKAVDRDNPQRALYVHWLCVHRDYAGQGYPRKMLDFAADEARRRHLRLLRLDTDANEPKLCKLYEGIGFRLMNIDDDGDHKTAFYQKTLN